MAELAAGTLIAERYRLECVKGQGGMGVVYRARDLLLQRDVAVKVLASPGLEQEGRQRLFNEARLAAALNHPNIVTIYDVSDVDGLPCIVMEYIEGSSLYERIPLPLEDVPAIFMQICAALEHAHQHGLIHRDIKPENVLIDAGGNVRLMDFGLARSLSSRLTLEGAISGTVFYLAPEMVLGGQVDQRADLYALGVMLYECVAGRLPFQADDPLAVISQHLHAPVVSPRAYNADLPPGLEDLILRLLEKSPERRPRSALEVSDALRGLQGASQPGEVKEMRLLERIQRGRIFGRENELQRLKQAWEQSRQGQGQVILISGEPGIGKTRLLQEISTLVEVSGGQAHIGSGYAESGAPYAPFASILQSLFDRLENIPPDLPPVLVADLTAIAPGLQTRFPYSRPTPSLDARQDQLRMFDNAAYFLRMLCAQTPLLVAVDDLHWADGGTLSLFRHLARRLRSQALLLVGTYREVELDEARPLNQVLLDLNRERLAERIKLRRLDKDDTRRMLAALFNEEITPEFLDGIYLETEGNPYFIEEVCKALVESGDLSFRDGRWVRPSMRELHIPQSIQTAIQARVARLPQEVQSALELAALIGREFDYDLLLAASGKAENDLISALETAEDDQLIREVEQSAKITFAFTHALIPQALRQGVRALRRRKLHLRLAEALQMLHPQDYEALAHHFSQAGEMARALDYFILAGDRAAAVFASRDAEGYYRAALETAVEPALRASLLLKLGQAQLNQSQFTQAQETLRESIELFMQVGDLDQAAAAYALLGRLYWEIDQDRRGLEVLERGLERVSGAGDGSGMASLLNALGSMRYFTLQIDTVLDPLQKALEMAERIGDVRVQVEALNNLTLGKFQPYTQQIVLLQRAIDLAERHGYVREAARAHNNLAVRKWEAGELEAAAGHFLAAAELASKTGNLSLEGFYLANLHNLNAFLGNLKQAQAVLARVKQIDAQLTWLESDNSLQLAFLVEHIFQGEYAAMLEKSQAIRKSSQENQNFYTLLLVDYLLCLFPVLDFPLASDFAEILEEFLRLAQQSGMLVRSALALKTIHHCRINDPQQACAWLKRLQAYHRQKPAAFDNWMVYYAAAQVDICEQRWQDARQNYERALLAAGQAGLRPFKAFIQFEWGRSLLASGLPEMRAESRQRLRAALQLFTDLPLPFFAARVADLLEGPGASENS